MAHVRQAMKSMEQLRAEAIIACNAWAHAADAAWSRELIRAFGSDAGNARYRKRGEGEPGTDLRAAYKAYRIAAAARVAANGE